MVYLSPGIPKIPDHLSVLWEAKNSLTHRGWRSMIRMQRFFFGQLLRGTTHKLNNILAVIHGFSSLLLMNESRDASEAENLEQMKSAAKRASILGEQILAAGGCSQVTVTEVNTDGLVSGLESSHAKAFRGKTDPIGNCA